MKYVFLPGTRKNLQHGEKRGNEDSDDDETQVCSAPPMAIMGKNSRNGHH